MTELRVVRPVGTSYRYGVDYPDDQICNELLRIGKATKEGNALRYNRKDFTAVKRRFKANAVEPEGYYSFANILLYTRSPWGNPQSVTKLPNEADGLYFVSTAGHGGLWMSDKWKKQLPKAYVPFTGNRRWAEEDCDTAEVLQYFGLLSLVDEPMELEVTAEDIEKGKTSRKTWKGEDWFTRPRFGHYTDMDGHYGGPISEAYCRVTGHGEPMINTQRCLQMRPGIWKYCRMPEEAKTFIKAFDAGEDVQPTTFLLEPYVFSNFNNPR